MRTTGGMVALALVLSLPLAPLSSLAQSRDIAVEAMRSEQRLALVIGNGGYRTSPLKNPVNDARGMAQALRALGFQVIARENVSQKEMRRAIIEFGERLRDGGVGLFYFAGHGLQVGGRNYLVPVDAEIRSESEVEVESVDVASVLARIAATLPTGLADRNTALETIAEIQVALGDFAGAIPTWRLMAGDNPWRAGTLASSHAEAGHAGEVLDWVAGLTAPKVKVWVLVGVAKAIQRRIDAAKPAAAKPN
jgi:hypothetical protein